MSDFSLTLVLQIKTSKIINGMAKVQQKSEKITALVEYFSFWTNSTLFCPLCIGITPDIEVTLDSDAWKEGYGPDSQLDRALQYIRTGN